MLLHACFRSTLLRLVVLVSAPGGALPASTLTIDVTCASEYVFRGVEQQDAALQPAVTYTRDALSLGLWSSQALTNRSQSWARGNETDLWGSYDFALDERTTLTTGGTIYLYGSARAAAAEPDHTWELSLGLARDFGPVQVGATWYHDFKLRSDTLALTLSRGFELPRGWGSLELGAHFAANRIRDADGGLPGTGGFSYRYFGADLNWERPLTAALTAKAGLHYTGVGRLPGAPDNLWFHLGVSAGF